MTPEKIKERRERIKDWQRRQGTVGAMEHHLFVGWCLEALDEIERLRSALEKINRCGSCGEYEPCESMHEIARDALKGEKV